MLRLGYISGLLSAIVLISAAPNTVDIRPQGLINCTGGSTGNHLVYSKVANTSDRGYVAVAETRNGKSLCYS